MIMMMKADGLVHGSMLFMLIFHLRGAKDSSHEQAMLFFGDCHGDQVGCGAQRRNTFSQIMSLGETENLGTPACLKLLGFFMSWQCHWAAVKTARGSGGQSTVALVLWCQCETG